MKSSLSRKTDLFCIFFFIISGPMTWIGCFVGLLLGWGWTALVSLPPIWMLMGGISGWFWGAWLEARAFRGVEDGQDIPS